MTLLTLDDILDVLGKTRTRIFCLLDSASVLNASAKFEEAEKAQRKAMYLQSLYDSLYNNMVLYTEDQKRNLVQMLMSVGNLDSVSSYDYLSCTHKASTNSDFIVDHLVNVLNAGSHSHAEIDIHLENTNNPHLTSIFNLVGVVLTDIQEGQVLVYDGTNFVNQDSLINARSGLSIDSEGYIVLGGSTLEQDALIPYATYAFAVYDDSSDNSGYLGISPVTATVKHGNGSVFSYVSITSDAEMSIGTLNQFELLFSASTGATFTDMRDIPVGILYGSDYSEDFVNNSIISKLYADRHIGGKPVANEVYNPGAPVDGFGIVWNNGTGQYELALLGSVGEVTPVTLPTFENALYYDGVDDAVRWGGALVEDVSITGGTSYAVEFFNLTGFTLNTAPLRAYTPAAAMPGFNVDNEGAINIYRGSSNYKAQIAFKQSTGTTVWRTGLIEAQATSDHYGIVGSTAVFKFRNDGGLYMDTTEAYLLFRPEDALKKIIISDVSANVFAGIGFSGNSMNYYTLESYNNTFYTFVAGTPVSQLTLTDTLDVIANENGGSFIIGAASNPTAAKAYLNGDFYINGNFFYTSDRRLKKNIRNYEKGLDMVMLMEPVQYTINEREEIGLIAQDLESVYRNAVLVPHTKTDRYGVDYAKIVPVLISSIQKLKTEIDQLKSLIPS